MGEQLIDWENGRVSGRVYTDPDVFEREIDRIFHGWWVYVGHESEVPEPGDYRRKTVGRQPLILSRTEDGDIVLLYNRCMHRGSTVCQLPRGNANFFRCQYHGWTYANDGSLVGVPRPDAYPEDFDTGDLGLRRVEHVGVHRGFIFASLGRDPATTFEEYLAPAKPFIDQFVDAAPGGRVQLSAGVQRTRFNGNWKLVGMDGYHAVFTHRSVRELMTTRQDDPARSDGDKASAPAFQHRASSFAVDLGQGHVQLRDDHREGTAISGKQTARHLADADADAYIAIMHDTYGEDAALRMARSDPHIGVWPNLQIIGAHVRVIHPVAVDVTEVEMYPAMLEGAPDGLNQARIRGHEWFYGPSSFGSPDDAEIFERCQNGMAADAGHWIDLSRGMGREEHDTHERRGQRSDETTQRGQLAMWSSVLLGEDRP